MTNEYRHIPVLLSECLEQSHLEPQHTFVDATLGGAGHSSEVAKLLGPEGTLIGIDQDEMALAAAKARLGTIPENEAPRIELLRGNFGDMDALLLEAEVPEVNAFCSTWAFRPLSLTFPSEGSPSRRTHPLICGWIRVHRL